MNENPCVAAAVENMLVAFFDLTGYTRMAKQKAPETVFGFLSQYYELVGDIVEPEGGRVVKFLGDAALIVFPEDRVDTGVATLFKLKVDGDAWVVSQGMSSRQIAKLHFGPVICGEVGTRSEKRYDIFGKTVNTAALLESHGFAMSPQVFRKLKPGTRQLFKKHTPPITYIPLEESHSGR